MDELTKLRGDVNALTTVFAILLTEISETDGGVDRLASVAEQLRAHADMEHPPQTEAEERRRATCAHWARRIDALFINPPPKAENSDGQRAEGVVLTFPTGERTSANEEGEG